MTETEEHDESTQKTGKKPLSISRPGKLELKKTVGGGQVRQSFSHGRSKVVAVEVRKKRTYALDPGGQMAEVRVAPELVEEEKPLPAGAVDLDVEADEVLGEETRQGGPSLTTEEKAARVRALQDAMKTDEDTIVAGGAVSSEVALTPEDEERERLRAEEEEQRRRSEEGSARAAEDEEARRREEQAKASAAAAAAKLEALGGAEEPDTREDRGRVKRGSRGEPRRTVPGVRRGEPRRRSASGRLTIVEALSGDEGRTRSLASVRRAREKERQKQQAQTRADGQKIVRDVVIPENISVQELANRMAERGTDVIGALMKMDVMASMDHVVDADTAELVVAEFGHNVKRVSESDVEIGLMREADAEADLVHRPPVVTVMGHVDHGKTSLLDALRETDVAAGEAGGITQHIGAYQVEMSSGAKITFIDTPGHEAFTAMRGRGAKVTDIVVLVVAADDGVMPQTIEAIDHAKAAEVPVIIAVNKIDKSGADPKRVRTDLLQQDIVVEEMGGDTLSVEVSATARINLEKLEEVILLQAEVLDLKANPKRAAEGVVIDAKMEVGRGSVATLLVQRGTLKVGDVFVAGSEWGRVRALGDQRGHGIDEAGPAMPVEMLGLNGTPSAGDDFVVVDDETRARGVAEFRQRRDREARVVAGARGTLEEMFEKIHEGEAKELSVVIKGDVQGSVEAVHGVLDKLSTDKAQVNVLHAAVGGINDSDVTLAKAAKALIIGFNVRANPQARDLIRRDGVEVRYYSVIYDVADDLKRILTGMLDPLFKENFIGYADIREVFNVSKVGKVAGCMVTEGLVRCGAKVRLLRDDVVVHEGALSQLKRFKDDVKEVKEGTECGMAFANYQDIKTGDIIECFEVEEIAQEL